MEIVVSVKEFFEDEFDAMIESGAHIILLFQTGLMKDC